MNDIQERLVRAGELPEVLGVASQAFEAMLAVARRNDDPVSEYFLPMVAAAASAATGRDLVGGARSVRPRAGRNVGERA